MQPWVTSPSFIAEKPVSHGWNSVVPPVSPWATQQQQSRPYQNDENLKKLFGVELAKCGKAFEAACKVFETDTSAACWIASNWLADPVVIAAKDVYLKEVKAQSLLLDKDAFAAMLMETALEKHPERRTYTLEAKERVNVLKLYADVRGFLAKDINTVNNFNNNEGLKVVFVKAAEQAPVTIDQVPNDKSEISNDYPSPIKIKLVGNG